MSAASGFVVLADRALTCNHPDPRPAPAQTPLWPLLPPTLLTSFSLPTTLLLVRGGVNGLQRVAWS